MQTHKLPETIQDRAVLARKMHIEGQTKEELVTNLMKAYESHTAFVGKIFSEQFAKKEKRDMAEVISNEWEKSQKGEVLFSENILINKGWLDE